MLAQEHGVLVVMRIGERRDRPSKCRSQCTVEVDPGMPLLRLDRIIYSLDHVPLEWRNGLLPAHGRQIRHDTEDLKASLKPHAARLDSAFPPSLGHVVNGKEFSLRAGNRRRRDRLWLHLGNRIRFRREQLRIGSRKQPRMWVSRCKRTKNTRPVNTDSGESTRGFSRILRRTRVLLF